MRRIALLITLILAVTAPVLAQPQAADGIQLDARQDPVGLNQHATFSPAERNLIRAHLLGRQPARKQANDQESPPEVQAEAARDKLPPPDRQRKVAPGHSLDYHLYLRAERLPDRLASQLPQPPAGYAILQVDNQVMLINSATRTVLDAFDLIPTR